VPVVYCASSLALASLEYFVHLDSDDWPDDLVASRAEVARQRAVRDRGSEGASTRVEGDPGPPSRSRILGSAWASASRTVALVVPSTIIPSEINVLLNPLHADRARVVVHPPERFAFDPRMRK